MKNPRRLACGHRAFNVDDYDDTYRWLVRCRECGSTERWTQGEWRGALSAPPIGLLLVLDDADERPRLAPV